MNTHDVILLCTVVGTLAILFGFYLGYQYCKVRWMVDEIIILAKVQTKLLAGEISSEEALKELDKIPNIKEILK